MQFKDLPIGTEFTVKGDSDIFKKISNNKYDNTAVITPDQTIDLNQEVSLNTSFTVFLFSPDGVDCVSDFKNTQSIDECWDCVSNMGSKWFFYPLPFIFGDQTNTVEACNQHLKCIGMTVKEVKAYLQNPDIQVAVNILLS